MELSCCALFCFLFPVVVITMSELPISSNRITPETTLPLSLVFGHNSPHYNLYFLTYLLKFHVTSFCLRSCMSLFYMSFFFFFNWSVVDLQCCANFCWTAKWLSCTHMFILLYILFHYALSQIGYSCSCSTAGPCCNSLHLNVIVCLY